MLDVVTSALGIGRITWTGNPQMRFTNGQFQSFGGDGFYQSSWHAKGHTFVDAATEMGKLIELLETKETRIKNITDQGDEGVISEDKKSIQIGCRRVSAEKVKEVYKALFE